MFHVMLVLPVLAVFGAMAVFILAIPFCAGIVLQGMFSIFGQRIWVLFIPTALGAAGLAASLIFLLESIPLMGILIYWGLYALSIWLVWLVIDQIRKTIVRWRKRS